VERGRIRVMPHLFCLNSDCNYHEQFAKVLSHSIYDQETNEVTWAYTLELADGQKRELPKNCRKCGCQIFRGCPNCQRTLDYWPPERCEGCGLDFKSVTFERPKKSPQLPK